MSTQEEPPYFPIVPQLYDKIVDHYDRVFHPQILAIDLAIREHVKPAREVLIQKRLIKKVDINPSTLEVGGVDGSQVVVNAGGLSTVVAVGVCAHHDAAPTYHVECASTPDNDLLHMIASGARVLCELNVLRSSTEQLVFMDGSLGAMARDINSFLRGYRMDGSPLESVEEAGRIRDALIAGTDCAVLALAERSDAFLMFPKQPMGSNLAADLGLPDRLPDVLLANNLLEPGEVLGPYQGYRAERSEQRTLRIGGEDFRELGLLEDVERRLEQMFVKLKYVFFKPHPWSRAFRIEYVEPDKSDKDRSNNILSAIHRETDIPGYVEPVPIFKADALAKQAAALSSLFGQMNVGLYPVLSQETRTQRR